MKKRLLLVDMSTIYGGAEVYLERLSEMIRYDFVLFHWVAGERLYKSLSARYNNVFRNNHPTNRKYLKNRRQLSEIVLANRIDMVFLNGDREQLYAPVVYRMAKTVVVTHMDIFNATLTKHDVRGARLKQFAKNIIYRMTAVFSHSVICVSPSIAKAWCRWPGFHEKVITIPNWPPAAYLSVQQHPVPPVDKKLQITIIGRLIRDKGHLDLIEACRWLPGIHIHIVGEGPDEEVIRAAADGLEVTFHGHVDNPLPLYLASDVVVLPSYSEGHPLCLIEAMALGIPCIAANLSGIRHLITAPHEGFLVAPGDVAELRTAIVFMKNHPRALHRMGTAGREKIRSTRGPGRAREAYVKTLTRVSAE